MVLFHTFFISSLPRDATQNKLVRHVENVLTGSRVTYIKLYNGRPRNKNKQRQQRHSQRSALLRVSIDGNEADDIFSTYNELIVDTIIPTMDSSDIPDQFQDPITHEFMQNPILLRTSNNIVNASTIQRILQSDDRRDPFNRQRIASDTIEPAWQLQDESIVWLKRKFVLEDPSQLLSSVSFPFFESGMNVLFRKSNGNYTDNWQIAKVMAPEFHSYIMADDARMNQATDRDELSKIFETYFLSVFNGGSQDASTSRRKHSKHIEASVMTVLRQRRLMKNQRYGDKVVVTFASTPGNFPDEEQQNEARDRILRENNRLEADKGGITVSSQPEDLTSIVVGTNETMQFDFFTIASDDRITLEKVELGGANRFSFRLVNTNAMSLPINRLNNFRCKLNFDSPGVGVYRCHITFSFKSSARVNSNTSFRIRRFLTIRSGDLELMDMLKPTSKYVKKKRKNYDAPREVISAPIPERRSNRNYLSSLPHHKVPLEIRDLVINNELESLIAANNIKTPSEEQDANGDGVLSLYTSFWQNLLWAMELQAYKDVQLFDMENVKLSKEGRYFVLTVPGLAEGRPSVLKGDIVNMSFEGNRYKGLVYAIRQLDILLEFDRSFDRKFDTRLDFVDHVRFTLTRTVFRTSHEGVIHAPDKMGRSMLFPEIEDARTAVNSSVSPNLRISWANRYLNEEQKECVKNILCAPSCSLPYIIFGPPGTGKTTTVVEVVYQLIRNRHMGNKHILLVAPSNDAADILVEKLSTHFSASELCRVLAYSRNVDDVSEVVKPFVVKMNDGDGHIPPILSSRLVVSTVNLAARFIHFGIPRGHFDVLCVDEAGHATEPEVIAVASSLMDFAIDTHDGGASNQRAGQLILAGDPKQLGPVITSDLCVKYGMDCSYMERIFRTASYSKSEHNGKYPSAIITELIRNYRSHPKILKLPNEMFYDDELLNCGDIIKTHNMSRWEHLPQTSFPLIFHAVHGENLQEGNSPSWFNPQEAQQVVHYVQLLVEHSRPAVQPSDIGIITPYARQAQKIRQALEKRCAITDIKVGSVETFQGQERRCIILSTVRAENEMIASDIKYNLGFVANEKRFNVAVTRAQALLIVIGNPNVLATDRKNWLPFLRFCRDNNGWAGQPWQEEEEPTEHERSGLFDDAELVNYSTVRNASEFDLDNPSQAVEQGGLGYVNREE